MLEDQMELKVSSPKPDLSPSDCVTEPQEKEISDDDDDDRNHKHRRRETWSQSSERDASEQFLTRPYRKRSKPFENGHPYRESDSQSSETWRNYKFAPQEKDLSARFGKGRPALASFSRPPLDSNQRLRLNQSLSGDSGPGRGKGRESGSWSQRHSRLSSDIASQMVQHGSVSSSLFAGKGLSNVSSIQSASWSAFGLVPGIPNGGLDTLHSLGLQGTFRPPINPSLSIGIPRQRCRDFDERGFCLRGDMCPLEHGVNRIVIEDVQSLSQFNLPVSLPSAHLMATPAGPGPLPAISAPASTLMNSKGLHNKSNKPGMADDGLGLDGAFVGSAVTNGADFYDPDQPLWANDCPEPSNALLALNPSNVDETLFDTDTDPSDRHHVALADGECHFKGAGAAVGYQSTNLSVWGRIGSQKSRLETKEKIDSTLSTSNYIEKQTKEDKEQPNITQGVARQGKRIKVDGIGKQPMDSSLKPQSDTGWNVRKPSQKALRTLFVNGIPQKNNKREALLSHFRKFGEVIDIYIPLNSERAFVQFSKREEAEAALKAPDAVMGNRFIKLWWANRDSIPDDGISSVNSVPVTAGVTVSSVPPYTSVTNKGNDSSQPSTPKGSISHASVVPVPVSDHPKHLLSNGPKTPPPLQKKLENLELLKELRKKQEMLDKKRNDFRLQLYKLAKDTTGLRGDESSDQAAKRHKVESVADVANDATPKSTDPSTIVSLQLPEVMPDNRTSLENVEFHISKSNSILAQEPSSMKQSIRPLGPVGAPFIINRFKLDNRPATFKIIAPLPMGLANVSALKEHFSTFGDLSTVDLEDAQDGSNDSETSKGSARISFTTRRSAERAFLNGKCWQGHNLHFMWLSNNSSKDTAGRENPSSSFKGPSDANAQPAEVSATGSQEAAALGNVDSEILEEESVSKHMEPREDIRSNSTAVSCEKQSP